jgi:hypothetical protein
MSIAQNQSVGIYLSIHTKATKNHPIRTSLSYITPPIQFNQEPLSIYYSI